MGHASRAALCGLWALFLCSACGASPHLPSDQPINFVYKFDERLIPLSVNRGKPLVLSLVRTSDVVSQLQLMELAEIHEELEARGVGLLVLTIEITEEPMLEPFVEFNELPFGIGLADPRVSQGTSPLGILPVVPVIYYLDEDGEFRGIGAGLVPAKDLLATVRFVLRR